MIDLTEALMARHTPRERNPKRVYVSEVYALLQGWEKKPVGVLEAIRMFKGTVKHDMVQRLLPDRYKTEVKIEYPFGGGYTLVGKADGLSEEDGIEIKTSDDVMECAKAWHVCQARLYAALFNRPFLIVQPVWTSSSLYLKTLRTCRPDQDWFNKTLKEIEKKLS